MDHVDAQRASCCWVRSCRSSRSASSATTSARCSAVRYVVDDFALVLKALFLLAGYVVVLMCSSEIEEGGYHQGEYYVLLLSSILGMVMMASARDLVSIFIALEFLSIPAYMLAAWNKRDRKSNEAGVKYYLLGVFASAVMLYGMSLLYGVTGTTLLSELGEQITGNGQFSGVEALGDRVHHRRVRVQGQRRAVPHVGARHVRGRAHADHRVPQRRRRRPPASSRWSRWSTSRSRRRTDVYQPFLWVLAALSMTVGNVLALRQTNIVRMLAYSSISQGGFILMPLAVASDATAEASLQGSDRLPRRLRGHQPRCVRGGHRRRPQDPQRRDLAATAACSATRRPRRADDDLPGVARRHPAARRLVRQVRRVQGGARRRQRLGLQHRGHRRGQHRHRRGVLRHRHARDVDEAGARRRRHAHPYAGVHPGCARSSPAASRSCSACCPIWSAATAICPT